uniref:Bridge-like lipid transfer protein family member 3A n=1 Tax=Cavia porcellus TaxID=10141 RepID=H0VTC0_CAVPO
MAGIIKKQILKHLSRFTKNLSPDKINLSTLKGEGQLTNLELDEEVLQNVLELPTWLAITRVYCNRASIRIQWTKLKTHPICLCLDKVEVEMKTCEEPRPPNGQSPIALASGQRLVALSPVIPTRHLLQETLIVRKEWLVSRNQPITDAEWVMGKKELFSTVGGNADSCRHCGSSFGALPLPVLLICISLPGVSANRLTGGAMQLTFRKMAFDYYPFHWAGDSCRHWARHCEAMETRSQWAQKLVMEFQSKMEKWQEETGLKASWHLGVDAPFRRKAASLSSPRKNPLERMPSQGRQAAFRSPAWHRLRSSCMVVRVDDLDIHQVSTAGQPSKKPSTLLSCSRKLHNLPAQISAIHIEFTEYYFPDSQELPVPCPNLYIQLNDLTFTVDPVSLLWGNLFCLDLYHSLEQFKAIYKLEDSRRKDEHLDIRLDAYRLKVSFPLEKRELAKLYRPQALVISASGMVATNTRHAPHCGCSDLQNLFRGFAATEFFHSNYGHFPKVPGGFSLLHILFLHHAFQTDSGFSRPTTLPPQRPKTSQDLWSIHFTQISLDFEGTENLKGHSLNFVAPFPLSIWACLPLRWQQAQARKLLLASEGRLKPSASFGSPVRSEALAPDSVSHQRSKTEHDLKSLTEVTHILGEGNGAADSKGLPAELEDAADVHMLLHSPAHICVRLDHYQYLALLRLKDVLQGLQEQLAKDTQAMTRSALQDQTACIGVLFPSAEVALLMHPAPGAVDADSAGSDTTSLVDSELSPSEEQEPKSDASSEQGLVSPEKVLEDSSTDNLGESQERPHSNGGLQDLGPPALLAAGKSREAVESLQAKRLSRAQASSSPAVSKSPVGKDSPVNGQGEPIPLKNIEEELSSAIHMTKDATKEALHATMDLTKEAMSLTKDAFSLGRDRMTSTMHKMLSLPPAKELVARADEGVATPMSGGAGRLRFFSMKRTVSQQSFDGVLLDNSGPEDRISVDSDGSDSLVMLLESESVLESVPLGSLPSVLDDTGVQGSPIVDNCGQASSEADSSVSPSAEDLVLHPVSVLVLKVKDVALGIEVRGEDLTVALQAEELALQQPGTMGLWKFLHGQCPGPTLQESSSVQTDHVRPAVGLRFEVGPGAAVHSPLAIQNGFLHFVLHGCDVELLTSMLNGLGPFLEDEEVPVVVPMQIELLNSSVTLKDDIPPIYPTSPGPVPITLAMEHVVLKRSDDGVFHISAVAQDRPHATVPGNEKRQPPEEQVVLAPTGEVFGQQVRT